MLGRLDGNAALDRRERDFKDAEQIYAVRVEPRAEIAVLVEQQALPVEFGHVADGYRLMVGVGSVVPDFDGVVGVVHVARAIEARIEGADEAAAAVVNGCRHPAFSVVFQLVGDGVGTGYAADGSDDINETQCE